MDKGFLLSGEKHKCYGCEACKQVCAHKAITMKEDENGFRYPVIDKSKCVDCKLCTMVCPYNNEINKNEAGKSVFGGFHKDLNIRDKSTSGGAFSAIVQAFCDKDYVIFGAEAKGTKVFHTYVEDVSKIDKMRKSKYSQSEIGNSFNQVKDFLKQGKKVLFSGTPCQIAGLNSFLQKTDRKNLLTVEVVCEGVPSPHYIEKLSKYFEKKYGAPIKNLDYRYTKKSKIFNHVYGKWDFQVMYIELTNGKKIIKDRWINPFWKLWLDHLMSRDSCYQCKYASRQRFADITLGDLWGVHLYCPELYVKNLGSSVVFANTDKGVEILQKSKEYLIGHDLDLETAIKYQSPLRKHINDNSNKTEFLNDLRDEKLTYKDIIKKWYKKPSLKLLWSKYIWGNRQKVFVKRLKNKKEFKKYEGND